ncbi:MAG: hypothetical protein E7340_03120 [Clostridiales bacterium]|nr:hypothetical protein [Clostridiales bacterium]
MIKNFIEKTKDAFDKLVQGKKLQYILIFIIVAILILTLVLNFSQSEKEVITETNSANEYVNELENKLSKALSKVEGVGEVSVVIKVESGMETVLATKKVTTKNSNGEVTEDTPIIVNGKTVVLKEYYPKITGVLIVAKGANKIAILNKIQQATVSLLDIELNQIEILTME